MGGAGVFLGRIIYAVLLAAAAVPIACVVAGFVMQLIWPGSILDADRNWGPLSWLWSWGLLAIGMYLAHWPIANLIRRYMNIYGDVDRIVEWYDTHVSRVGDTEYHTKTLQSDWLSNIRAWRIVWVAVLLNVFLNAAYLSGAKFGFATVLTRGIQVGYLDAISWPRTVASLGASISWHLRPPPREAVAAAPTPRSAPPAPAPLATPVEPAGASETPQPPNSDSTDVPAADGENGTPPVLTASLPAPTPAAPMPSALATEIQVELQRLGCFPNDQKPTGHWGNKSKQAANDFNQRHSQGLIAPESNPAAALDILKSIDSPVCAQ